MHTDPSEVAAIDRRSRLIHHEPHPLAGRTVTLAHHPDDKASGPVDYWVEDWQDRVYGFSWMDATGNPAALKYAMRSAFAGLPTDNEVVYGKVGPFGHIVHVSELIVSEATTDDRAAGAPTNTRPEEV